MNEELLKNADECYRLAEERAAHYFQLLHNHVKKKTYVSVLTEDMQTWKQYHIHPSLFSFFLKRKREFRGYYNYIQWLDHIGKLEDYLDRSISYIFMRDLGKDLSSQVTQNKVRNVVSTLKDRLVHSADSEGKRQTENISMSGLYRWAQKEGIESAIIWLNGKIKNVSIHIPEGMDAEHAQRKLIKIIAGVMMHVIDEMDDKISADQRSQKLDAAIRLGYSYGLTYPFIDDLLDADVLSSNEKMQYSHLIRTALMTGTVPELGQWTGENKKLIQYIHLELREAFEYIKAYQQPENRKDFFNQAYVFFHSQEADRTKDLSNPNYTNDDLFLPIILKSSSSRLIVRSVISAPEDEGFDSRTFFYGIYNQLADDFTDMFEDLKDGAVTPYTYYMKYRDRRSDLINPFELYWTVIYYLIHHVYHSDAKACEVILDRAINSLKRFKKRMGKVKYNEVMELFASGNMKFNRMIQRMADKAEDVDFFDKLLRDHIITILKNERKEREAFSNTIESVRNQVNNSLAIPKIENASLLREPIIDAANYSIEGDGKRLRPIMTWTMGVHGYGLDRLAIIPLLRSLEYMHTASLIFDDLPSQDNSPTRRGRPTLHEVYNIAIAELAGLFLTQKAVEEQASLEGFDPKTLLSLIQYSAQTTELMCRGQAMDLDSKGKQLTLEQLDTMCFYKTGIAFEASLIMPAILARAPEFEREALKKYARHAGIAFQIKDDLLDAEGEMDVLGKPIGKDSENHQSTFVTILGKEEARKAMWEHYCLATEALQDVHRNTTFLKQLLNYIVNRNH